MSWIESLGFSFCVVWDKAPKISFLLPFSVLTLASGSFSWFLIVLLSKDQMGSEICFPTLLYPMPQSYFFCLPRALSYIFILLHSRDLITLFHFSCPFPVLLFSSQDDRIGIVLRKLQIYSETVLFSVLLSTPFLVNAKVVFFIRVFWVLFTIYSYGSTHALSCCMFIMQRCSLYPFCLLSPKAFGAGVY